MAVHLRTVARHTWRTVFRVTLMLFIIAALITGLLLGTERGRIVLFKNGMNVVQLWSGQQIAATGVRSPGLGEWIVEDFVWQGSGGIKRLQLSDVRLSWRWYYALQNRWWFEQLQVSQVTLALGNQTQASSGSGFSSLYEAWPSIPAIRFERIHVDRMRIERPRYSTLETEVDVEAEVNWGSLPLRFFLSLSDSLSGNKYALQLSADAIDRVRLIGSLRAEPETVWAQWLQWELPQPAQATWNINIDYSQAGQLLVDIDDWQMPWQSHELEAEGRVRYDVDEVRLQFDPLAFRLNDKPAELSGWLTAQASELSVSVSQWELEPFAEVFGYPDLQGKFTAQASWLGGWRRPRLNGQLDTNGTWRDYPFSLSMTSVAELNSLNITQADLVMANNDLTLKGQIDWITEELDFSVQGQISSDPLVREILPDALAEVQGDAQLSADIQGFVTDPQVRFDVKAQGQWRQDPVDAVLSGRWQSSQLTLDQAYLYSPILQAEGQLQWQPEARQLSSNWQISEWRTALLDRIGVRFPVDFDGAGHGQMQVNADGDRLSIQGDMNVQGLWQEWPLNAQFQIDQLSKRSIVLGASRVALGQRQARVSGEVDWSQQRLDLQLEHQDWPLRSLQPWLGFWPDILTSLQGKWTGETRISGPWTQPAIASDSQVIGSWFDEPLRLSLQTRPLGSGNWRIPELSAEWLGASWRYEGAFRPYQLELDGEVSVRELHARHLPLLSERFTGQSRSLPERMDIELDAEMTLRGRIVSPNLSGQARVYGELDQQPFDIRADVGYLDVNYIDIDQASGQWADGRWSLDGLMDWRLGQVALQIETQSPSIGYLVPWLQLALNNHPNFQWLNDWQGSLNGQMQIDNRTRDWLLDGDLQSTGELFGEAYDVRWQGEGRLQQSLQHTIDATWGAAEANASLRSNAEELTGDMDIQRLRYAQLRSFAPQIPDWVTGVLNGQIDIGGRWQQPDIDARLTTTGRFNLGEGLPFTAHAELNSQAGQWRIGQSVFEVPGAVSMTVAGNGQGMSGKVDIEGLLPDTGFFIQSEEIGPGEAAFNLTASGNLLEPTLSGGLEWRAGNWPIVVTADLITENDSYQLSSALYSDNLTRIKAQFQLPVKSLDTWRDSWQKTPAELILAVNSPFSVLDPFIIDQPDIRLDGDIKGQLTMTGTVQTPRWQGELFWENGQLEHAGFGSLVDNIELSLSGEQQQWEVDATATDGNGGRISVAGDIQFDDPSRILGHSLALTVGFENAGLLNQAQMDAAISGDISVTGSYRDLLLQGRLNVEPLNLQSDTFLWEGAPQLNIVSSEQPEQESDFQRPAYLPDGQLDLRLIANNRANLYGQGITAQLAGELSVTDNLYEPVLAGRFNLVRGTYTGLGRVFQLTSGSVQIQNNQIVLDIRGEHQTQLQIDDQLQPILISLRITGNQNELGLSLTSNAGLEQDELLAQLLFGKIVAELDVFQAIQLANVVNKLRTGDTGFDLIGATRDSFDLDSLIFDTESDEQGNLQFNISAGKYITDFLYLEVQQDVGVEQEFRGSIQYQISPNTNIELYTQGEGGDLNDNGVELNWSWDY